MIQFLMVDCILSMKKYFKSKKIWLTLAIILVVVLIIFFKNKNGGISVTKYVVSRQDVIKTVTASGKTSADKNLEVKSQVAAQIAKINFNSGDSVNAGDVVIVFDKNSLTASANSLWNSYLTAKATMQPYENSVNAAQKDVDEKRYRRDYLKRTNKNDSGYTASDDFNTAQSSLDDAISALKTLADKKTAIYQAVESAYSSYIVAQKNLTNGEVKAPASGLLALEDITTGSNITLGQTLFRISNSNFMQFIAEIDETDIQYLKLDQKASVTLDAYPNTTFEAKVLRMDVKTRKNDSGGSIVEVAMDLSLGDVRPIIGTSGSADIYVDKRTNELVVPLDSVLLDDDKKYYVFKILGDKVQKLPVMVSFEGDEFYAISEGLLEGDVIATGDNFSKLIDGSKISVTKNK